MSAPASSTSSLLGLPHLDQSMEQSMEQSMDQPMDKPQKKRRRPALACEQCRRRKVRCDRNIPCSHCIKSNITDCSYVPTHIPASKNKKSIANTDSGGETSSPHLAVTGNTRAPQNSEHIRTSLYETVGGSPSSTAGSSSKDPNVDWLVARVQQLEQRLEKVIISGPEAGCEKEEPPAPVKGTVSKTRYFGRSHWMCGTSRFPTELEIFNRSEAERDDLWHVQAQCKRLGRIIKENRLQPLSSTNLGRRIPTRDQADPLVEAYFRTYEGVLRILHVPTFRAEYERYWQNRDAANDFFKIQLQLVMALGAPLQDEIFRMRSLASQWVYEAQLWLMLPPEKSRMTIAGIQIMSLLTLARSVCAVGQDLVWVTTGGLLREAMYMGLHRDPKTLGEMTTYRAEMRRRLWATVMELNLQSSFDAGGPPLISVLDCDVLPPANLEDVELTDELDQEGKRSHPPEVVTAMSLPLELLKSLHVRLSLLKHANDFRAEDSYDETLRLNSEITKACRSLSTFIAVAHRSQHGRHKIGNFHTSMAEMIIHRCFHTLHQPLISQFPEDPKFYFSRKVHLESSMKILNMCGLAHFVRPPGQAYNNSLLTEDFHRLIINGSGIFRNIVWQSSQAVAYELILKVENEPHTAGLGYAPGLMGDYKLREIMQACMGISLRRIRSGETNIKGHVFAACLMRHADALEAGLCVETEVSRAAMDYSRLCLAEVKQMAVREGLSIDIFEQQRPVDLGVDYGMGETGGVGETGGMGETEGMGETGGMDWMADWAWDDIGGLLWGSPRPLSCIHPHMSA